MKVPKNANKADRIKLLEQFDNLSNALGNDINDHLLPASSEKSEKTPSRSKHCNVRLLNVLFGDNLCERFSQLGTNLFLHSSIYNNVECT